MTTPSFELDQDLLDLRSWVHDFAAEVVRPAAAEWDERADHFLGSLFKARQELDALA